MSDIDDEIEEVERWIRSERRQVDAAEYELDNMRAAIKRALRRLSRLRSKKRNGAG